MNPFEWSRHVSVVKKLTVFWNVSYSGYFYRPQGKVMFSEACVILFTGRSPPSLPFPLLWTETHPSLWAETPFPLDRVPLVPLDRDPPRGRHPGGRPPPGYRHLVAATAAVGARPAGMHSCSQAVFSLRHFATNKMLCLSILHKRRTLVQGSRCSIQDERTNVNMFFMSWSDIQYPESPRPCLINICFEVRCIWLSIKGENHMLRKYIDSFVHLFCTLLSNLFCSRKMAMENS